MPTVNVLCVLGGEWYAYPAEHARPPYFGCCGSKACMLQAVSALPGMLSPTYIEKAYLAQQAVTLAAMEAA